MFDIFDDCEDFRSCGNCEFRNCDVKSRPCRTCFDRSNWVARNNHEIVEEEKRNEH